MEWPSRQTGSAQPESEDAGASSSVSPPPQHLRSSQSDFFQYSQLQHKRMKTYLESSSQPTRDKNEEKKKKTGEPNIRPLSGTREDDKSPGQEPNVGTLITVTMESPTPYTVSFNAASRKPEQRQRTQKHPDRVLQEHAKQPTQRPAKQSLQEIESASSKQRSKFISRIDSTELPRHDSTKPLKQPSKEFLRQDSNKPLKQFPRPDSTERSRQDSPEFLMQATKHLPKQESTEFPKQPLQQFQRQDSTDLPTQPPKQLPRQSSTELPNKNPKELPIQYVTEPPKKYLKQLPRQDSNKLLKQPQKERPRQDSTELRKQPPKQLLKEDSIELLKQPPKQLPRQDSTEPLNQPPKQLPKQDPTELRKQPPKELSKQDSTEFLQQPPKKLPRRDSTELLKQTLTQIQREDSTELPKKPLKQLPTQGSTELPNQHPKQLPIQYVIDNSKKSSKQYPRQDSTGISKEHQKQDSFELPKQYSTEHPKQSSKQLPRQDSTDLPKQPSKPYSTKHSEQTSKQLPRQDSTEYPQQPSKPYSTKPSEQPSKQLPRQDSSEYPKQQTKPYSTKPLEQPSKQKTSQVSSEPIKEAHEQFPEEPAKKRLDSLGKQFLLQRSQQPQIQTTDYSLDTTETPVPTSALQTSQKHSTERPPKATSVFPATLAAAKFLRKRKSKTLPPLKTEPVYASEISDNIDKRAVEEEKYSDSSQRGDLFIQQADGVSQQGPIVKEPGQEEQPVTMHFTEKVVKISSSEENLEDETEPNRISQKGERQPIFVTTKEIFINLEEQEIEQHKIERRKTEDSTKSQQETEELLESVETKPTKRYKVEKEIYIGPIRTTSTNDSKDGVSLQQRQELETKTDKETGEQVSEGLHTDNLQEKEGMSDRRGTSEKETEGTEKGYTSTITFQPTEKPVDNEDSVPLTDTSERPQGMEDMADKEETDEKETESTEKRYTSSITFQSTEKPLDNEDSVPLTDTSERPQGMEGMGHKEETDEKETESTEKRYMNSITFQPTQKPMDNGDSLPPADTSERPQGMEDMSEKGEIDEDKTESTEKRYTSSITFQPTATQKTLSDADSEPKIDTSELVEHDIDPADDPATKKVEGEMTSKDDNRQAEEIRELEKSDSQAAEGTYLDPENKNEDTDHSGEDSEDQTEDREDLSKGSLSNRKDPEDNDKDPEREDKDPQGNLPVPEDKDVDSDVVSKDPDDKAEQSEDKMEYSENMNKESEDTPFSDKQPEHFLETRATDVDEYMSEESKGGGDKIEEDAGKEKVQEESEDGKVSEATQSQEEWKDGNDFETVQPKEEENIPEAEEGQEEWKEGKVSEAAEVQEEWREGNISEVQEENSPETTKVKVPVEDLITFDEGETNTEDLGKERIMLDAEGETLPSSGGEEKGFMPEKEPSKAKLARSESLDYKDNCQQQ